jgi:hypothetical protein
MQTTTPLLLFALGAIGGVAVLGACTPKPQALFSETSPQVVSSPASEAGAPHYMGRWAVGVGNCDAPMVIQAKMLSDGATNCEFAKVESSTAGYSISAVCRAGKGPQPGRLTLTLPDPQRAGSMTLAGGPYKTPVALERCAARP